MTSRPTHGAPNTAERPRHPRVAVRLVEGPLDGELVRVPGAWARRGLIRCGGGDYVRLYRLGELYEWTPTPRRQPVSDTGA